MKVTVQSIDRDTRGWLRHRFIRALTASYITLVVFGLLVFLAVNPITSLSFVGGFPKLLDLFFLPVVTSLVVLLCIAAVIILIELVSAIVGALPRRLTAFVMLIVSLSIIVGILGTPILLLPVPLQELRELHAVDKHGVVHPRSATQVAAMYVGFALGFSVALKWCAQGWWQLTASPETFRSVCGWRPPAFRLLASFRRHIGLPAFLSHFGRGRKTLSVLYFFVAVLNTSVAILLFLPWILSAQDQDQFITNCFLGVLGALLLLNLFGVGRLLARLAARRATHIYQSVREWDSRAPVVFLRTFTQDEYRMVAGTYDPLLRLTAGIAEARTVDEIILEHASPYGPVIAIGNPRDPLPPLGAARIFLHGESWKEVVTSIVDSSKAIIMCPSQTEGVRWELNLIGRRSLFPRTVFFANPERPLAETTALFAEICGRSIVVSAEQMLVALFFDPMLGCRVLTARRLTFPAYTVALNMALQVWFGAKGVPLTQPVQGQIPTQQKTDEE